MTRDYPRLTLRDSVELAGPGLHSGEECLVKIHPGQAGFRFHVGGEWIEAHPKNVTDTTRCTRLGEISTVEHVLSGLAGLGVTDADIEVAGGELPAADGCSSPYSELAWGVGLVGCGRVFVEGPFARVFLQELPAKYAVGLGEGWWRAAYIREEEFVGRQEFEMQWSADVYRADVARARTFVLESELELARAAGLGKGLSDQSCLLVTPSGYGNESRYDDEPSRHKLLDLIGDLALSGVPIAHLDVVAEHTGHTNNVRVAQKLAEAVVIRREG